MTHFNLNSSKYRSDFKPAPEPPSPFNPDTCFEREWEKAWFSMSLCIIRIASISALAAGPKFVRMYGVGVETVFNGFFFWWKYYSNF